MYSKIIGFRKRYGDNWVSAFPDGLEIPWRALSLQEFLDYDDLFRSGRILAADIEDEIFEKAVLEPLYIHNIDILPAGTVSVVATHILQVSGIQNPDQLSHDLNNARSQVQDFISSSVILICSVFPAYKPEDVLNLSYSIFMNRLAMAEKRLLELGLLKEPLSLMTNGSEVKPKELPSQRKRREILEAKRQQIDSKLADLNKDLPSSEKVFKTAYPEGIVTTSTLTDSALSFVPDLSNDPNDHVLNQIKVEQAQKEALLGLEAVYPEYFKLAKEGKQINPETILSVRGQNKEQVKQHHEDYIKKIQSGEIKIPTPSQTEIKSKTPGKIRVKRR